MAPSRRAFCFGNVLPLKAESQVTNMLIWVGAGMRGKIPSDRLQTVLVAAVSPAELLLLLVWSLLSAVISIQKYIQIPQGSVRKQFQL